MGQDKNYIQWIRSKVGHDKVIFTFAGGCIFNDKGEYYNSETLITQNSEDSVTTPCYTTRDLFNSRK